MYQTSQWSLTAKDLHPSDRNSAYIRRNIFDSVKELLWKLLMQYLLLTPSLELNLGRTLHSHWASLLHYEGRMIIMVTI